MGALPKRRWSTHRQGKKRKNLSLKLPALVACPNCKAPILPHQACPSCGYYKGKEVVKKGVKGDENTQRPKTSKKKGGG